LQRLTARGQRHQILQPGPAVACELVAGVPKVVEVHPRHAERLDHVRPPGQAVEVASPDRPAHDAGEDQRPRLRLDVHRQVPLKVRDDRGRDADYPGPARDLGGPSPSGLRTRLTGTSISTVSEC
jgi:hypothetical protein